MNDRVTQNSKQNNTITFLYLGGGGGGLGVALPSLLHYPVDITSEHVMFFIFQRF